MQADGGAGSFPARSSEIDLRTLGHSLWRKKWKIIVPALVVAVLAAIAVNLATPQYESEARLLVEGRENVFLRPAGENLSTDELRAQVDQEAITSQAQILQSRDIALEVIKELKLAELPEFDPVRKGLSVTSTILSLFGLARDATRQSPEERMLTNYFERLSVLPIDRSRVIQVAFTSSDPQLSARVVNAIIDAYFRFQRTSKIQQNRNASQWLESEIERLRPRVAESEGKVESFRAKANLFVGTGNASLANQQLSELTRELAAARSQKADLDARSRAIRNMLKSGRPIESADITNSELIRRLVEQRVTLRSQLAEQSSTLLGRHPRIKELNAQISGLDGQIRRETVNLVQSLENDARIAGGRIEETGAAITKLKSQIAGSGPEEVQLRALEREARSQRDLLESYLAKYREASARDTLDAAPSEVRVISRAIASSSPSFPKKIPIVAIATLATIFIATTLIVTADLLDPDRAILPVRRDKPSRPASTGWLNAFRRRAGLMRKSTQTATAAAASGGAATLSIGALAMALRRAGEAGRRIALAGTARNVGTTYAAIGIGRALVQQGARTVLVDLAFGSPNLSVMSSDPAAPGIADVVRGSASFGDIVTRDRFSGLHIVAAGRFNGDSAAILSSPRLAMTLEALARSYDHILVDAGTVAEPTASSIVKLIPRAVLVSPGLDDAATRAAQERLLACGFIEVTPLNGKEGAQPARSAAA